MNNNVPIFFILFFMSMTMCLLIAIGIYGINVDNFDNDVSEKYNILKKVYINNVNSNKEDYSPQPIPKLIFRTWCTSDRMEICGGRNPGYKPYKMTSINTAGWEERIYSHDMIDDYLNNNYGKNHRYTLAYNLINPMFGASRSDLFRYIIIHDNGGLYIDMKSCVTGNVPEMPKDKDLWVSHWSHRNPPHTHLFGSKGEYINWYVYGRKGSPILKDIIENIVYNIFSVSKNPLCSIQYLAKSRGPKSKVLCVTGPIASTLCIKNSLNNKYVNVDNSINLILKYSCGNINNVSSKQLKNHYSQQFGERYIKLDEDYVIIPRNIYIYDPKDNVNMKSMKKKYPLYEIIKYDDKKFVEFLNTYYSGYYNQKFNTEVENREELFKRTILYVFGGVYINSMYFTNNLDLNQINNKSLTNWYKCVVNDEDVMIATYSHNDGVSLFNEDFNSYTHESLVYLSNKTFIKSPI